MSKSYFILFFALLSITMPAQEPLFLKKTIVLNADHFWGRDTFDALFFSKENVFTKEWNHQKWEFTDYSLGELTFVSLLNPLKILLFYGNSNTVVILDKYLNEIKRIDFNVIKGFVNIHSVSPANDNTIWVFNSNSQRLELFNTITLKTILSTQPINQLPVYQYSNFNFCWLVTDKVIYKFNVYGSLVEEIKNNGFSKLQSFNEKLYLFKDHNIYTFAEDRTDVDQISLPEIKAEQFYVTDEILYIYDLRKLYSFDITSLKK